MKTCIFRFILQLSLFCLIEVPSLAHGLVTGGFDYSRGGGGSLRDGAGTADLRADLKSSFPDVTFAASNTLTDSYLNSVDVLYLQAAAGDIMPITPLNSTEQTSLLKFVKSGGGVLILGDASPWFDVASNSMLSPFGVHLTGWIDGPSINVTVTNMASPVTNGPFGAVTSYRTWYPGWFDSLGTKATSLARIDSNGQSTLAQIDRGALSPGSGTVVLSSDTSLIFYGPDSPNMRITKNAIAFVAPSSVPEPSTVLLLGSILASLVAIRKRVK